MTSNPASTKNRGKYRMDSANRTAHLTVVPTAPSSTRLPSDPTQRTPHTHPDWARSRPVVRQVGCSILTPAPGPLRDEPADATGYPLPPLLSCGQDNQRRAVHVLLAAVNSGHQRRTEVPATRSSARITWHDRQIPKL